MRSFRPTVRPLVLLAVLAGQGTLAPPAAASPAAAQAGSEPEVTSMLSSGLVKLGSELQWILQVRGADSAELLEVPEVDGLSIRAPSQPRVSRQTYYQNGRTFGWTDFSWSILVRPAVLGEFTIPPARLRLDGREVLTEELSLKVVRDMRGMELGAFEVHGLPQRVYEGEPFEIDLRFGWDAKLGVQRARLILPWWQRLRGVVELAEPPRDLSTQVIRFGLNARSQIDVEELPTLVRDGRAHRAFRLRRRFLASRPGTLELPESYLEFAELSGSSRLGQTFEEYYVHLPAASVEVRAIPEEGRPFEWTGAVGKLFVDRRVDRRDVDVGDSIELTVSWTGAANLEFFVPPDLSRLEAFSGFRQLGVEDEFLGDERRVTYDLVPTTPELTEVPPVPLWIFDPELEAFREIESEGVPIRVRALAKTSELEGEGVARPVRDIRDLDVEPARGRPLSRPGAGAVAATLVFVPSLWLAARVLARRRGDPDAPAERRRRRARRRLARDLATARSSDAQSAALARFLAGRTGEGACAWLGRDPVEWARERAGDRARERAGGRPPERARDGHRAAIDALANLIAELDRRTWSGGVGSGGDGGRAHGGAPLPGADILAVADRLLAEGLL